MENERFHLEENIMAIPFKDNDDLQNKLNNPFSIQLIEEEKEINVSLYEDGILLQFINQQENYIDICYLYHKIIDCNFRINNTLYNNESIIISEITSTKIFIPSKSCYNANRIADHTYIIQCYQSIDKFQYFILNNKSEIIDEIIIDLPNNNCKYNSKFQYNKLIINSIDCEISIIQIIYIINKDQQSQFSRNITKLHELHNYPNQSNLIDVKICDQNMILLGFNNAMTTFDFKNQQFRFRQYDSHNNQFEFLKSCFPYVFRGLPFQQGRIDNFSSIFQEMRKSQLKSIECFFDQFCIFQFEDQVIVMQDYLYKQSIQQVKQIQRINTLPYLLILKNNNEIKLYKISCLNRFFEFKNFPFLVMVLTGLSQYQNLLITTKSYQTNQYLINYPIEIPIIKSVEIFHNLNINNKILIDINALCQSIPFYIEFEQDNIHFEFSNSTLITHHINLSIKQILKIISLDIQCVIIIYQNWNHKIIANIKNNNIDKNIEIISTRQQISVEYQKLVNDQILLILISSDQIMKFKIVEKNKLIFVTQFYFKQKLQEYKYDLIKIFLVLTDNTIYICQDDQIYTYYSTKMKEYKDCYTSNQDIKYNDFRVPYLYIDHQACKIQIKSIIPFHNDILISVDGQIVLSYIFVLKCRILLIVKKQNQLYLNLYYFDTDQIYLLYQMPTYEFQIQQPINIKFYGNLFGIVTIQNEQQYLFIYDVTKYGSYCLRQITKILPDFNSFELIDETGIFNFNMNDKIIISYPILGIRIKDLILSDSALIHFQIEFKVKSFIQSIPTNFIVYLQIFNNDINLRYKHDVQQYKLLINTQNEMTNLDIVYGSINRTFKRTIQIVSQTKLFHLSNINQRYFLLSQHELIYDYFGLNKTISSPLGQIFLNDILISNQSILITYDLNKSMMSFINLSTQSQYEDKVIQVLQQEFKQFKSLNIINNFIIVLNEYNCYIYKLNKDQQNLECEFKIYKNKQIYFLHQEHSEYFFLLIDSNYQFQFQSCNKNLSKNITIYDHNQDQKLISFHLLNSNIVNQEILFTVIFFLPMHIGYIIEFTFNFTSWILIEQSKLKLLRYTNITFINFLRVSDAIYILKGISQSEMQTYYLYNINQSCDLIDYYYKYQSDFEIKIYNETHFIQTKNYGGQKIIELIEINHYKVYIQNDCEVVLQNDVSIFTSTVVLEHNLKDKSYITSYLIIVNSLLILIISNKNQKKKIKKNTRI